MLEYWVVVNSSGSCGGALDLDLNGRATLISHDRNYRRRAAFDIGRQDCVYLTGLIQLRGLNVQHFQSDIGQVYTDVVAVSVFGQSGDPQRQHGAVRKVDFVCSPSCTVADAGDLN